MEFLFLCEHPIFQDILYFIRIISKTITGFFGMFIRSREPSPEETEQLHENQLAVMVERVTESEALDDDERELLQSVFEMGKTLVREVMVPRTDMVTISSDQGMIGNMAKNIVKEFNQYSK